MRTIGLALSALALSTAPLSLTGCAEMTPEQRTAITNTAHYAVMDLAEYLRTGKAPDIRGAIAQAYGLMNAGKSPLTRQAVQNVIGYVIKDSAQRDAVTESVMDTIQTGLASGVKKDDAINLGIQVFDAAILSFLQKSAPKTGT